MASLEGQPPAVFGEVEAPAADILDLVVARQRADIHPRLQAQQAASAAVELQRQVGVLHPPDFQIPHTSVSEAELCGERWNGHAAVPVCHAALVADAFQGAA